MNVKLNSTSLWITVFAQVAIWLAHMTTNVSAKQAVYLSAASAVAYVVSRTIAKYKSDLNGGHKTTEFYVALATVALTAGQELEGHVSSPLLVKVVAGLGMVLALSRGLVIPGGTRVA